MKAVERYRAEIDAIKAPAALKEKLLAIPAQYDAEDTIPAPAAQETQTPPRQNKKAIPFSLPQNWKKYALTAAACFAVGVLATDALGWQVIPRMSSMASDTSYSMSSTSTTSSGAGSIVVENSVSLTDSATEIAIELGETSEYATRTSEDTVTAEESADTTRKIIYTTSISLETMAYDDTLAALSAAANAVGGYLETSELHTGGSYNNNERYGYFTYRIPAEHYATFLTGVSDAGNITYQSENANDVTTTYLDLEARITTLTQQRDRLWELQAEAESLSDLLEIESTLTEVLYQIESYQSQLNYLADQVDYATVSISLDEVIEYTTPETSIWDTIANTFIGALTSFATTIGAVLLTILSLWVWIALALVAFFVYHSNKKKKSRN